MKTKIIQGLKFLTIPFLGLSMMGNKGCNDKPEARLLRMDVEIGSMKTQPLQVEDQEAIKIDQLTKALFSRAIYSHNHFSITNLVEEQPGTGVMARSLSSTGPSSKHTELDQKILFNYGFKSESADNGESTSDAPTLTTKTLDVPTCQWEEPQLVLNSDVLGFELVNKTDLGLGYSPSGTHLDQLKGTVKFSTFRLDYGVAAVNPLLNRTVASTEAVSHKSSVDVEFDFGKNSPLTINFFYQDALVKVIKEGMNKSLNRLVARLEEQTTTSGKDWNKDVWESRVVLDPAICGNDECVAIRGGSLNRIKIGDRFHVINMIHTWEGEPCASNLVRSVPNINAINEIIIESVGDTVSVGRVLTKDRSVAVEPGAMVKLVYLNDPPPPSKK